MTMDAALLLSDTFSYSDGALTNVGAPRWVESGGGGSNQEVLVVSGRAELNTARSEDVNAALGGQPYASGSAVTLYAGFTVNFSALPSSAGTYFAHFNVASNHRCRVWAATVNAAAGTFRLGVGNSTTATAASGQIASDLALNTTYTVVVRYVVNTGVSTIWLNPASEASPGVTASDATTAVTINGFSFRQSTGIGVPQIDNLKVADNFAEVIAIATGAPQLTSLPQPQTVTEGGTAVFEVAAAGAQPLFYQWNFNNANIANATNSSLQLVNVLTNQAGSYGVAVSNSVGATNAPPVTLTVTPLPPYQQAALSLLTYNVKGNGATNWSTNSLQVQAIGRQVSYLHPDIITFLEIPLDYSYEMTNFMKTFLPGYSLATNSGSDGFIRAMIASRFPITRSSKWLDGVDLRSWGYSNANNSLDNFTRDLFEAQINVPGFTQPLHVFTTHLKSTSGSAYADAAAKRAAEAAAITNFFATNLFVLYPSHPYVLTGDMNDGTTSSGTNTLSIERLTSPPTGLHLTSPVNPATGSINTFSSQRIDYIFPGGLLFSNINNSQVFRTDKLSPTPPQVLATDSATASDHWPVLMVFNNPYAQPFRLTSIAVSNSTFTLRWESTTGQSYRVEKSSNLTAWTALASNLTATGTNFTFTTNLPNNTIFFRVVRP